MSSTQPHQFNFTFESHFFLVFVDGTMQVYWCFSPFFFFLLFLFFFFLEGFFHYCWPSLTNKWSPKILITSRIVFGWRLVNFGLWDTRCEKLVYKQPNLKVTTCEHSSTCRTKWKLHHSLIFHRKCQ